MERRQGYNVTTSQVTDLDERGTHVRDDVELI